MDIETRVTKVEEDVDKLKVQCAVAQDNHVSKADLLEAKVELRSEIHNARTEFKSELSAAKCELKEDIHALELRVERAMHAQTWRLLGGMFAMLTATVTIVYYTTS